MTVPGIETVKIGLWVDDPPSHVAKPAYFDKLQAHNIDLIDIMVDTVRPGWDPKRGINARFLSRVSKLAEARNIDVALTIWPEPVRKTIDDMVKHVPALIEAAGAVELCSDTESNYHPRRTKGFRSRGGRTGFDLAGDYLVDGLREIKSRFNPPIIISQSTFTSHTENGRAADVAPHMDLVLNQAYGVRNRNKKNPATGKYDLGWKVPWDHSYGPGRMVHTTLDRTEQIPGVLEGKIELGAGLPAYDQKWPRHSVAEAMAMSLNAATDRNVSQVRYWSSKWIVGVKSDGNKAVSRFMRSLR
jgi:hypothetical protein